MAFVEGVISADTQEDAREMLANCEFGTITNLVLHEITLTDELGVVKEEYANSENGDEVAPGLADV